MVTLVQVSPKKATLPRFSNRRQSSFLGMLNEKYLYFQTLNKNKHQIDDIDVDSIKKIFLFLILLIFCSEKKNTTNITLQLKTY